MFIHQGFDNDDNLEYRDIILNITYINNHAYDDYVDENWSNYSASSELFNDTMRLQYLIKCTDDSVCGYISEKNSSIGMDHTAFEGFVTTKLRSYFTSMDATSYSSNSALLFVVDNVTASTDAMGISSDQTSRFSIFRIILCIFGALCLLISGISIGVILYHRKIQRAKSCTEAEISQDQEIAQKIESSVSDDKIKEHGHDDIRLRRLTSTYNAEGQEGVIATGVILAKEQDSTSDEDDHLETIGATTAVPHANSNSNETMENNIAVPAGVTMGQFGRQTEKGNEDDCENVEQSCNINEGEINRL